jgi:hypothetical protein
MNIGWPEGIILGFMAVNVFGSAVLDGEPRTGKHKFAVSICSAAVSFGLLYWGGFFS